MTELLFAPRLPLPRRSPAIAPGPPDAWESTDDRGRARLDSYTSCRGAPTMRSENVSRPRAGRAQESGARPDFLPHQPFVYGRRASFWSAGRTRGRPGEKGSMAALPADARRRHRASVSSRRRYPQSPPSPVGKRSRAPVRLGHPGERGVGRGLRVRAERPSARAFSPRRCPESLPAPSPGTSRGRGSSSVVSRSGPQLPVELLARASALEGIVYTSTPARSPSGSRRAARRGLRVAPRARKALTAAWLESVARLPHHSSHRQVVSAK